MCNIKLDSNFYLFGGKGDVWSKTAHIAQSGSFSGVTLCGKPMLSSNHVQYNNVTEPGCQECINQYEKLGYMNFEVNQEITVIVINGLAMTSRWLMKVKEVIENDGEEDYITVVEKGKRKRYTYKKSFFEKGIILKGWDHKLFVDSDGNYFAGNACFNLVSDMTHEELRKYLDNHAYQISDESKSRIFHLSFKRCADTSYEKSLTDVLYPEISSSCAPMEAARRITEKSV